ncbi:Cyclin-dependent kinase 20 [Aphelenchoides besseyi]|nr:Cyclin-dependent kinase 20 [Aphelenchoides besseyi]
MKVLCLLALIPVLSLAAVVPFVPADVNVNSKVETAVVNAKASVVEAKAQVAIPKVPLNEQAKQLLDMIRARNTVDQPGLHFLCSPCKTVFTDVLVALEDVETIEEPALKAAIEIIELRDVVFGSNDVALVFDYVETNLKIVILDLHRPRTDNLTRFFFTQLLRGIEHLHELNIMHRDLKPENILIRSNGTLQIADFGLACLYLPQDKERTYSHEVATRWYRSPELLFGATRYTPTVDIWAFGCILAEYLNNSPLFEGSNDIEQIGRIFNVLGTPTESSWPQWRELPDSTKVHFDSQSAVNEWSDIGELFQTINCTNYAKVGFILSKRMY